MDKQQLIDALIDEVTDTLNAFYANEGIDINEDLDSQWTGAVLEALKAVSGNVQAEGDDRSNPNTGAPYYDDYEGYI